MSLSGDKYQLVAIVFTNIVDYTTIMEQDEQLVINLLKRKRGIVYPLVDSYGGKVLSSIYSFSPVYLLTHCLKSFKYFVGMCLNCSFKHLSAFFR